MTATSEVTIDTGTAADPAAARGAERDRRLATLRRTVTGAALAAAAIQVALGAVWWLANLGTVPAYGDTSEYLTLSQSLQVDGYRTLAFPVLLRLSRQVAGWAGLPYQLPLYLVQSALAVAVTWYLVRSASLLTRRRAALVTAVVVTSPLVLHYMLSVLSDSVSTSLFVLALAGLARIVVRGDRRRRTWILTFAASAGAALTRTEKWYVLLGLAACLLVGVAIARRFGRTKASGRWRAVAVAVVVVLVVPAVLATVANRATQTADYGRPSGLLAPAAISRIVWPHLEQIRDQLPAEARAKITPAQAAEFDHDLSSVLPMTSLIQSIDGGGNAVTWAAVRAALRCCGVEIAAATLRDAGALAVAPVTFGVDTVGVRLLGAPAGTNQNLWDLTRMETGHPRLTDLLVGVSLALMALLAAAAVLARLPRRAGPTGPEARRDNRVLFLVWFGTVLNGCSFAAAGGGDGANVRYNICAAMAVMCALAVWGLARRRDEAGPA